VNLDPSWPRGYTIHVRFTPNSDRIDASQRNVGLCQYPTYAAQQIALSLSFHGIEDRTVPCALMICPPAVAAIGAPPGDAHRRYSGRPALRSPSTM